MQGAAWPLGSNNVIICCELCKGLSQQMARQSGALAGLLLWHFCHLNHGSHGSYSSPSSCLTQHACCCGLQDDAEDDDDPAGEEGEEDEEGFVVGDGYLSEDEGLRDEDGDAAMTPAGGMTQSPHTGCLFKLCI